jgi:hypothetical protein
LSLVLRIVLTVIHVSVVHVSFAEATVYRNSSAYPLRKTLYEVGSRRTAVFIKINSGNTQYIYYFLLIFPLAFIYLFIYVFSLVFLLTSRVSVSSSVSLSLPL